MTCWCAHPEPVHAAGVCRLCVGSPYQQSTHRYRNIADLPLTLRVRTDFAYLITPADHWR